MTEIPKVDGFMAIGKNGSGFDTFQKTIEI